MSKLASFTLTAIAMACLLFVSTAASAEETEGSVSGSISLGGDAEADAEGSAGPKGHSNHRTFNVHLAAGAIFGLGDDLSNANSGDIGGQGTVGFDIVLIEPLALSVLGGYNGFSKDDFGAVQDLFVGAGLRLRLFTDYGGSLSEEGGNAKGNLWIDAHFNYHSYNYEDHGGYNIGLGYEFALIRDFNLGPYVRFQHTPLGDGLNYMAIAVGLQISLGGKFGPDDADGDGIEDDVDKCPKVPEDKDGFEDEDGCPDEDNDEDGILDVDDKCPDVAGVASNEGCPENDNDHDGIVNDSDQCPDDPEDFDEFEDEDGCPDLDNDKDEVLDTNDKCPLVPEDKDGFEDEDGCPDEDNDQDGILDASDQCPNEAESKNGIDDEDGCPDLVRIEGNQIKILQKVYFATNKDTILERSFPVLEEVSAVIVSKTDIRVRIEGHTDDRGRDKKNLKLSNRRAASVVKFLSEHGVPVERLESVGLGETKPIADNKTSDGRADNRRVEFHIVTPEPEPEAEAAPEAEATPEAAPAAAKKAE
jgi:outer membrane protein OmpA-like peptidoglycan-associated protein